MSNATRDASSSFTYFSPASASYVWYKRLQWSTAPCTPMHAIITRNLSTKPARKKADMAARLSAQQNRYMDAVSCNWLTDVRMVMIGSHVVAVKLIGSGVVVAAAARDALSIDTVVDWMVAAVPETFIGDRVVVVVVAMTVPTMVGTSIPSSVKSSSKLICDMHCDTCTQRNGIGKFNWMCFSFLFPFLTYHTEHRTRCN